jgi:hypothetical protein
MSIHRSYFSKGNTIIYNSETNTSKSPYVELFFGDANLDITEKGFSRFIFDLDLEPLKQKINNKTISNGCDRIISHKLRMTNTSSFDKELLNDKWSNGRRRATSFDLVLFRIPNQTNGDIQLWDGGVGYDYEKTNNTSSDSTVSYRRTINTDKSFSDRPSNWFKRTTIDGWETDGIYDNNEILSPKFSDLVIVDTQHFDNGNEDIEFDMTNEINSILNGEITNVSGWGIAFYPQVENITGLTENYSVGFFSPYTQTFYEPFLETNYDDLILDDRGTFYEKANNKIYLYSFKNGTPKSFDKNPRVDLFNTQGELIEGFENINACEVTNGVYEVNISGLTADTLPCIVYDVWKNLSVDETEIDVIENQIVVNPFNELYKIGVEDGEPTLYGFDFYGIKQDEKILNTDMRKVNVIIKKAYTVKQVLTHVNAEYRVYVKEGMTEVMVQDWTQINRTPTGHYFVFDTRDKIPNEYFIDIKVTTDKEVNTYKRELKFQIVNKK